MRAARGRKNCLLGNDEFGTLGDGAKPHEGSLRLESGSPILRGVGGLRSGAGPQERDGSRSAAVVGAGHRAADRNQDFLGPAPFRSAVTLWTNAKPFDAIGELIGRG
jgi:hypothetical protein